MKFERLNLSGAYLIDLDAKEDKRGFFARFYCDREFGDIGLNTKWAQVNNSLTRERGTLRGLHFQKAPHAEVKLIRCLSGAIWDVIVDIRNGSATFGCWFGHELSERNRTMMYVPKGFAHGFITIANETEILYMVSDPYAPDSEETLAWDDPSVGIDWPITPRVLSDKDRKGFSLSKIKKY